MGRLRLCRCPSRYTCPLRRHRYFLDYPDFNLNELGARGIGEIGLAGVAPAITAAVYHATGVRVRELPVRIEDLLLSEIREA